MTQVKRLPRVLLAAVIALVSIVAMASTAVAQQPPAPQPSPDAQLREAGDLDAVASAQRPPGAPPDNVNDEVLRWTYYLQQTIRLLSPGAPTPITRSTAMMYGAIYDAVNSITPVGTPYLGTVPVFPGCAQNRDRCLAAAVNNAASFALAGSLLNQNQTAAINYVRDARRFENSRIGFGPGTLEGRVVGSIAAVRIIIARLGDGSGNNTPYVPGTQPGAWRSTGPECTSPVTPNWGRVRPFALTSGSQFRPPLPGGFPSYSALLSSALYAAQVNEVKRLGRFDSQDRTADQTEQALFWSNDVDGTYKPPGQHLDHTRIISQQRGLTLQQNARLFGLLGIALADTGITTWGTKYDTPIDLWRPETAIQQAAIDGNPATQPDPNWEPLLLNGAGTARISPCFPAYTSGHASFGGTWSRTLERFFGTDAIAFVGTTDDPQAPGVTRSFTSLSQAGGEDAISRIYLGVHYRFDAQFGLSSGRSVADFVFNTRLRPLP